MIKDYLESNYSGAASFIQVQNIDALFVFKDSTGKEVATHAFKLTTGVNEIPICEFGDIKKEVRSVDIKVKSFAGYFSVKHSF